MTSLLENGALVRDASSTEGCFCKCPRQFLYKYIHRRVSSAPAPGRDFGKWFHEILAQWRLGHQPNFESTWETCCPNMPLDDFRTLGFGKDLFNKYVDTYGGKESFTVLQFNLGGVPTPCVERSFALPLGSVDTSLDLDAHGVARTDQGPIPVLWSGKIDLGIVEHDGELWVLDTKTSSVGGDTFWADFQNSTAQHGYVWALQQATGRRVAGFRIDAVFTRAATRTGKGCELFRQSYPVSPAQLEEFVENALHIASSIIDCVERNYWPKHTGACVHRYGKCEFMPVCENDPANRIAVLASNLYVDNTWSPLV